jgi:imidazolonepropionase
MRELAIIQDGAVLISNGVISAIGPSRRIENLAEARYAQEINAEGRVVMPAFIDGDSHLAAGIGRLPELLDTDHSTCYNHDPSHPVSIASALITSPLPKLQLYIRRLADACLRHGTATLEAKSGYGLDDTTATRILRAYATINRAGLLDLIPTYVGPIKLNDRADRDQYIEWLCNVILPKIAQRHLAYFVEAHCSPSAFDPKTARTYLKAARDVGLSPKIHSDDFQVDETVRLGIELRASTVAGLNTISEQGIRMLGKSPVMATLLPASAFFGMTDRFPPARELIDAGSAVALSSGFQRAGSTYNMQMIVALACDHMRMHLSEAIVAATINAAHALGAASRVGSLETGKDADLILLNVSDYREMLCYLGVNLAALTMKRGEVVCSELEVHWPGK